MIIQDKIDIKVNSTSLKYYRNLGYDVKLHDNVRIDVNHLTHSSFYEIEVKCDCCGKVKKIKYYYYLKNIKKYNLYCCSNLCAYELKNKNTNIEKYGFDSYSKTDEFKNKYKETCLKEYGVDNASKEKNIRKKLSNNKLQYWKNKLKKEYNVISINEDNYEMKCDCGKEHNFFINKNILNNRKQLNTILCTICHPVKSYFSSGLEIQLRNFIEDNYNNVKSNYRLLGKELDIYIPELKLAFEFNGLYWHNELNKPNNYHLEKTELCENNGIQLIHIYEDDWIYKQDIIKSMILNKLGKLSNKIYARKTKIKEITDNKLVREFLDKNHIQGYIRSSIKVGLFYEDELVSLMIFIKRKNNYELLRFCNKLNTNVIDGSNKLFKFFIKNYNPKIIITYADRSWSQGNLYKQLGFKSDGKTQSNYYYIVDRKRNYRNNETEHQIMLDKKIYRIFDSGNLKFIYIG